MKIALAQINCLVGDLEGNAAKILDYANRAKGQGATLLVTPELALTGYPPEDLLLRDGFLSRCLETLYALAQQISGIAVVVGHPDLVNDQRFNAASVLRDGKIIATYHKQILPNHSVFDEMRYFTSGTETCVFDHDGVKFGLTICADIWEEIPVAQVKEAGAQVLLALNASPYHMNKHSSRLGAIRERTRETGMAAIYTNLVGGQDELVFDGMSFAMNRDGEVACQLPAFKEALHIVEWLDQTFVLGEIVPEPSIEAAVYGALTLGVQDYVDKNGFKGIELG